MGFFNSLPVPELREWNYPFPFLFPNSQMSFPLTPVFFCPTMSFNVSDGGSDESNVNDDDDDEGYLRKA